jgi:hypothetical protein
VKYIIAMALTLSSAACTQGGFTETVLPSPTQVMETANAVCNTQITALNFDVDYSGPHLLIDISFAAAPSPVEIEIERYQDGRTEPVAHLTDVVGRTRVALNFNTRYRGRARAGSCPWSPWVDQQIGPPNPCGDCAKTPTPPPPPPPPPPPDDDDDDCESNQESLTWQLLLQRTGIMRMEAPPPPPPQCSEQ